MGRWRRHFHDHESSLVDRSAGYSLHPDFGAIRRLRTGTPPHSLRHFGLHLPFAGLGSQGRRALCQEGPECRARANPRRRFDHDGDHERSTPILRGRSRVVVAARIEGGDVVLLACPSNLEPIYLITRPEIKSAAELKGKSSAVTRLGSSTHFYLRAALRNVGLDSEKDITILQLGAGPEMATALESGRIAVAALNVRYAIPFLKRNWPVLVDLTKTDLIYPSSCVTSSRAFVKSEPKVVEDFLSAYVAGIQLIKKDPGFAERSLVKWTRETDPYVVTKSIETHARIFKAPPYVPDKGIENVVKDLTNRRNVSKDFIGRPELFRDNVPLDRALSR